MRGTIRLLVERLVLWYDPWDALAIPKPRLKSLLRQRRQNRHAFHSYGDSGPRDYDLARIHHFYLCYTRRTKTDPIAIQVSARIRDGVRCVYVIDGHHRLCGAIMAGMKTIGVLYQGPQDVLKYLKGKIDSVPNLERADDNHTCSS